MLGGMTSADRSAFDLTSSDLRRISAFARHLDGALLACDFDGTLAPIVNDPTAVRPHPDASRLLAVAARRCRVAIITGRPAEVAVETGGLASVPHLVVLGHYGAERWEDGMLATPHPVAEIDELRRRLVVLADQADPGVRIEDKGLSVALHTRNATDPQGELERLRPLVDQTAADLGMDVAPGRFVLEVRPPGVDKGHALRSLVEEVAPTAVLFAGDDLGDLPAVTEVRRLADAGLPTLVVCSESEETPPDLAEHADLRVPGPAGVVAVLDHLLA